MFKDFQVKVGPWDPGIQSELDYKGMLSLGSHYFFFSAGEDTLQIQLPSETKFRVVEEAFYTAMFKAINNSKDEQGLSSGTTLTIWGHPLQPEQRCYVVLGEEVCVEFCGAEPQTQLLQGVDTATAIEQILERELKSQNDLRPKTNPSIKPINLSKEEEGTQMLQVKAWSLEVPIKSFSYGGFLDYFDSIYLFVFDRENSLVLKFSSYNSFSVSARTTGNSIGGAIESIRIKQSLPPGQCWYVWNSVFGRFLDSDQLVFLNTPEEERFENVILTATHEIEILGRNPRQEFHHGTFIASLMFAKFRQTRVREREFLSGTSAP